MAVGFDPLAPIPSPDARVSEARATEGRAATRQDAADQDATAFGAELDRADADAARRAGERADRDAARRAGDGARAIVPPAEHSEAPPPAGSAQANAARAPAQSAQPAPLPAAAAPTNPVESAAQTVTDEIAAAPPVVVAQNAPSPETPTAAIARPRGNSASVSVKPAPVVEHAAGQDAAPEIETPAGDTTAAAPTPPSKTGAKADRPRSDEGKASPAPAGPTAPAQTSAAAAPQMPANPAPQTQVPTPALSAQGGAAPPEAAPTTTLAAPPASPSPQRQTAEAPLRAGRDAEAKATAAAAPKGKTETQAPRAPIERSTTPNAERAAAPPAQASAPSAAPDTSVPPPSSATAPASVQDGSRAIESSAPHAARAHSPAGQVAQQIVRRIETGATRFEMRIDPPELGSIEVKLEMSRDHRVTAMIAAEDPATLSQLARAAREIETILQSAGLELRENGLSFDLAQSDRGARDSGGDAPATVRQTNLDSETAAPTRALVLERWRGQRLDLMA